MDNTTKLNLFAIPYEYAEKLEKYCKDNNISYSEDKEDNPISQHLLAKNAKVEEFTGLNSEFSNTKQILEDYDNDGELSESDIENLKALGAWVGPEAIIGVSLSKEELYSVLRGLN